MKSTSIDTETTGVDRHHGASPFFVTVCHKKEITYWEWRVDPITREPQIPKGDIHEIQDYVDSFDEIIAQNSKFDINMLVKIGVWPRKFPWEKLQDTLIAGHLLASASKHNLTDMVMDYLHEDIEPLEKEIHKATEECRRRVRSLGLGWMIAKQGLPCMPSAKEKCWKYDMWLPRELLLRVPAEVGERVHYNTVLRDYANADSDSTYRLWPVMEEELHRRGLWDVYKTRMRCLQVAYRMEHRGISVSVKELASLKKEYIEESEKCETVCETIAEDYDGYKLTLPKSGNNKSLTEFIFNRLELPILEETDKGNPCLDSDVLEEYEATLPPKSQPAVFIQSLRSKRKRDKAVEALEGYENFLLDSPHYGSDEVKVLYPNANMTGTATLRWGFNNPNTANVSKKEDFNLRRAFGPALGREWYSLDAENIELRIPAYEAGEKELIEIFDRPNDPPYYGSYHLVIFDTLYPELFKKHGKQCKVLYESTYYQWVKNGDFAIQYGAQEKKADLTYRVPGAYKKIKNRFRKVSELNDRLTRFANKTGYILTIPDKESHPTTGYPLMCKRSDYAKVVPTTPLCYHVSGTAMQWMGKAMERTDRQIEEWRNTPTNPIDIYMILQVHDELVFDFPKSKSTFKVPNPNDPTDTKDYPINHWRVNILKQLMEKGGQDIGIPTPCSVDYHPVSWAIGISL